MCDKEIVVCAAIWVQDHKNKPHGPVNIPSGTVFCGLRHCSIISQLAAYGIAHKNRSVQGFLTSKIYKQQHRIFSEAVLSRRTRQGKQW